MLNYAMRCLHHLHRNDTVEKEGVGERHFSDCSINLNHHWSLLRSGCSRRPSNTVLVELDMSAQST